MKKRIILVFCLAAVNLAYSPYSSAFEFEGKGITGNFDTTISWGVSRRIEARDPGLIGRSNPLGGTATSVNTDDGDVNYGPGLISNVLKVTHDLDINYKNFGAFMRGTYLYDPHNNNKAGLSQAAKDRVGKDADLLDVYIRGSFDVKGKALDVRVGSQVVSWGESTFIQNSLNILNPVNVAKIRIPGAELREALFPVPMIWASQELTDNVSVEAVYLVRFKHTEIDPRGTYFSTNDFASDGGQYVTTGFGAVPDTVCGLPVGVVPAATYCVPRIADREARDSGQYGLALRWMVPDLNDTEFGFYFVNYHSRVPLISAKATANPFQVPSSANLASYFVEYPEDIKMLGVSFNTELSKWGVALQGEYSHRTNVPLQVEDVELLLSALCSAASQLGACPAGPGGEISGYRRHRVGQLQFTATKVVGSGNPFGATQWVLLGEIGVTHVYNLPNKSVLRYEGPGTSSPANPAVAAAAGIPAQTKGYADATSWGYRLVTRFDYDSVGLGVNVSPRVAFAYDVNGTSPGPGGNFIEGRKAITLGLGWNYLNEWAGDFSFTTYYGAGNFNQIHDRDFVALNVKYSF